MSAQVKIGVVIPCYMVSGQICEVIKCIGEEVDLIIVVDDCCPENSGALVEKSNNDPRVRVIYHETNQGVGGAVLTGYRQAIEVGVDVIVKIDGDGQMDPQLISSFVAPILSGDADYTKGNRFYDIEMVKQMPPLRIVGNMGLSFLTKLSSGYWNLFDPSNGYTAISAEVAQRLPVKKISRRYFFESDMLFRLNVLRAVAVDIPMFAKYGDEKSNLKEFEEFFRFVLKNFVNFGKRIIYNYFIRDFNYASLELLFGLPLLGFGVLFGGSRWISLMDQDLFASSGTVMLAALPVVLGFQLLLGFVSYDMASVPSKPIQSFGDNKSIFDQGREAQV